VRRRKNIFNLERRDLANCGSQKNAGTKEKREEKVVLRIDEEVDSGMSRGEGRGIKKKKFSRPPLLRKR